MPRSGSSRDELASEVWRRLFALFMSTRPERDRVLERLGLTPNDAKALGTLEPGEGVPMRTLAEAWGTDASNATWVVDRLERKGLAVRRPSATDRRVKQVALTPQGAKTKAAIMRAFHRPPARLRALGRAELEALRAALEQLDE